MKLNSILDMLGNKIIDLANATAPGDAVSLGFGDGRYLQGQDSGWVNCALINGWGGVAGQTGPAVRKFGNMVFMRGMIGVSATSVVDGATPALMIPAGYYPTNNDTHRTGPANSPNGATAATMGYFWIRHTDGAFIPTSGPNVNGQWWAVGTSWALS